MQNQTVVSLADFRYVSVFCPQCNSRTILDMGVEPRLGTGRPQFAPSQCPTCYEQLDSAMAQLNQFQRAYLALKTAGLGGRLSFLPEEAALILKPAA